MKILLQQSKCGTSTMQEAVKRCMAIYTDILKELRKDKQITQAMMAKRFGISRVMYGYYETGRRVMPPEMLSILADELETSTDYILGRTARSEPYPPRMAKERTKEGIFTKQLVSAGQK